MKKKIRNIIISLVIFLVLLALMISFYQRAHIHYSSWKEHHEYLKQQNPQIQPWMTISMISKIYDINQTETFQILNTTRKQTNPHITLELFCSQKKIDCNSTVKELQKAIGQ